MEWLAHHLRFNLPIKMKFGSPFFKTIEHEHTHTHTHTQFPFKDWTLWENTMLQNHLNEFKHSMMHRIDYIHSIPGNFYKYSHFVGDNEAKPVSCLCRFVCQQVKGSWKAFQIFLSLPVLLGCKELKHNLQLSNLKILWGRLKSSIIMNHAQAIVPELDASFEKLDFNPRLWPLE